MKNFTTLLVPQAAANVGSNLFIRHVLRFHKLSYPTLRNQLLNSAGITISNVSQKTYRGSVLSVLWYCCKYHRRLGLGGKQALNQSRRIFSFGFQPILGIQRHSRPWKPPAILLLALLYPLLKYYFGFLTKKRILVPLIFGLGLKFPFYNLHLPRFWPIFMNCMANFRNSSFRTSGILPSIRTIAHRFTVTELIGGLKNWWEGMLFCKNHYHMVKN